MKNYQKIEINCIYITLIQLTFSLYFPSHLRAFRCAAPFFISTCIRRSRKQQQQQQQRERQQIFHSCARTSEPSKVVPSTQRPSTSVIEVKPPPTFGSEPTKPDIKPTKPVSKPTKQLSSVVRVVSAANPSPSIVNTSSKSLSSKVQIVSSHVEVMDENKNGAPHKSVVQVKAIDGDSHGPTAISASRVEVVDGISPIQSYVERCFLSEPTIVIDEGHRMPVCRECGECLCAVHLCVSVCCRSFVGHSRLLHEVTPLSKISDASYSHTDENEATTTTK